MNDPVNDSSSNRNGLPDFFPGQENSITLTPGGIFGWSQDYILVRPADLSVEPYVRRRVKKSDPDSSMIRFEIGTTTGTRLKIYLLSW